MFERLQTWLRLGTRGKLTKSTVDLGPHGTLLVLRRPPRAIGLRSNAVAEGLGGLSDGSMPYVGILIDFAGCDYRFSSFDLGALLSNIAAWVRGWVAPCAVVLPASSADELRRLLELVKVDSIDALRVVPDAERGMAHIREFLARRGRTKP